MSDVKTKSCPHCGGQILAAARKCKHCQAYLDPDGAATGQCPRCAAVTVSGAIKCRSCGEVLDPAKAAEVRKLIQGAGAAPKARCPHCAETIITGGEICPFCKAQTSTPPPTPPSTSPPSPTSASGTGTKPCPFCGEEIKDVAIKCRFCGEYLDHSRARDVQRQAGSVTDGTPRFRYNWLILLWPALAALVLGYVLGNMIYGARFQSAVGRVLSGLDSGDPSEGRTIALTILILLVIGEAIGGAIMYRRRQPAVAGGALQGTPASPPAAAPKPAKPIPPVVIAILVMAGAYLLLSFALAGTGSHQVSVLHFVALLILVLSVLVRNPWMWRVGTILLLLYAGLVLLVFMYLATVLATNETAALDAAAILLAALDPLFWIVAVVLMTRPATRQHVGLGCSRCGEPLPALVGLFTGQKICRRCRTNATLNTAG